ncbi:hypothetical protein NGA_0364000, partial [Nannochloropsis gaditana CCMP526]
MKLMWAASLPIQAWKKGTWWRSNSS